MSESKQHILDAKVRQQPSPIAAVRCCATCENLQDDGYCVAYEDYPPGWFIEQENDCDYYTEMPPF